MFSTEEVDAWLRENCRRSGPNWVWPRGTTYTQEQSREIVRIHLSLGMGPTEMITVEMIGHLLRRIESLEKLFGALGAVAEPVDFLTVPLVDGGTRTRLDRLTDGRVMCCLCFDYFGREQLNPVEGGVEDVCTPCADRERTS